LLRVWSGVSHYLLPIPQRRNSQAGICPCNNSLSLNSCKRKLNTYFRTTWVTTPFTMPLIKKLASTRHWTSQKSPTWAKNTCHFVFDYNSDISWSIFILFVPMETGRNTLQFTHCILI